MTELVHRNSSYLNAQSTTGTVTRVKDTSPNSGMCPLCIHDFQFLCEIGLSAFRGREALYPQPEYFGCSTAGALKDFGLDWSHFNIQARLLRAFGVEENPDVAIFPSVNTETSVGGIPLKIPVMIGAYGSTDVASLH